MSSPADEERAGGPEFPPDAAEAGEPEDAASGVFPGIVADDCGYRMVTDHVPRLSSGDSAMWPCTLRRFTKVRPAHGGVRVWSLVDSQAVQSSSIVVPGVADDPWLFDVCLFRGAPVFVQALLRGRLWTLTAADIQFGQIGVPWTCAVVPGRPRKVIGGNGLVFLLADTSNGRAMIRISLAGFSTELRLIPDPADG